MCIKTIMSVLFFYLSNNQEYAKKTRNRPIQAIKPIAAAAVRPSSRSITLELPEFAMISHARKASFQSNEPRQNFRSISPVTIASMYGNAQD